MKDVACVLLGAGLSKRMGKPKLLVRTGGKTVFEMSLINHLGSSLSAISAVVPGWIGEFESIGARYVDDRVRFVRMDEPCPMSDSLKAGWKDLEENFRFDAVMISLADQPLVTTQVIDRVIAACARSESPICVPAYGGRWGHPVIISAGLGGEIMQIEGDRGARDILSRHRDLVEEIAVDTDAVLIDVDKIDDLDVLRSRLDSHE